MRPKDTFPRGSARLGLVLAFASIAAVGLCAETPTFQAIQALPSGVFRRLISTAQTILARDDGNVGVGTPNPAHKLEVAGVFKVTGGFLVLSSYTTAGLPPCEEGAMAFNSTTKRLVVCSGGVWK